jgi:MFS family permease
MPQWKKNLYVLWVGTFIAGASFSLVSPFLPALLKEVGVTNNLETWSGVAFSASFIMSALMSPIWGAMADKYGRKIMMIRSGIGIGLTYIGMAYAANAWQIIGLRALNGFLSGFIPSAIALVATNTPDERLGSSLGLLQTGSAFGSIMGPLCGGLLSHYLGIKETLLLGGWVLFGATAVVMVGVHEIKQPDRTIKTNVLNDLRTAASNRPLMMMLLTVMFFQSAVMILQPVLPIYIEQLTNGADASLPTGIIFSVAGLATVIAAPFWGKRGEKFGYRGVLMMGIVGAGIMSVPHAFTNNLWVLGGLRFTFGLFLAAMMPASNALIAKAVPADFRGRAFGISTSFSQAGAVIGPLLGGFIGGMWNIQAVFIVTAAMLLVLGWWLRDKTIEQPAAAQSASVEAAS